MGQDPTESSLRRNISRRRVLQGIGVAGLTVGVAPYAQAKSAAKGKQPPAKRIQGSYDSPISDSELEVHRREMYNKTSTARSTDKNPISKPDRSGDKELIDYQIIPNGTGIPSVYYGSAGSPRSVKSARELADKRFEQKKNQLNQQIGTMAAQVGKSDEWEPRVEATHDNTEEPFGIVKNTTYWYQLDPNVADDDEMQHVSHAFVQSTPGEKKWDYWLGKDRWLNYEVKSRNFWGQDYSGTKIMEWDPSGSFESGSYRIGLSAEGFEIGWTAQAAGELSAYYEGGSRDLIAHKLDELTGDDKSENTVGLQPGSRARMDKNNIGCNQAGTLKRVFSVWGESTYETNNYAADKHTLKCGIYVGWPC